MNEASIRRLLDEVAAGELSPEQAAERLAQLPFRDLDFAKLDLHRELRTGVPEAIFAERKTAAEIDAIVDQMLAATGRVLVTRLDPPAAATLVAQHADAAYDERARVLTVGELPAASGEIVAVCAAGTSDLGVAGEAAVVARWLGHPVATHYDIGVAGLHRMLSALDEIRRAGVVIVVAGMEGALPSVLSGLLRAPIVAVPTSVGYGVGAEGLAAVLAMLSSCSPGIGVVNIDNGFGAAVLAHRILAGSKPSTARPPSEGV